MSTPTTGRPAEAMAAAAALIDQRRAWHASLIETALEPNLPIIDPHHHLWDRNGHTYLLPQLLEDTASGHRIEQTVYLECQSMYRADGPEAMKPVGEVEFVNGIAAMSASGEYGPQRLCAGIVSHADLGLGAEVRAVLEAQIAVAGGRLKGIRYATAWDADDRVRSTNLRRAQLLADPAVRAGFAQLAPLGLSFDAWVYHPQIADVIALADAFPSTRIVLDHVGGVLGIFNYEGRRDEVFATWRASILELAKRDNVVVKLGGLGMRTTGFDFAKRDAPPPSIELAQAWRPYLETCIEAFGVRRCMFESNFPVDSVSCSYGVLWNALKRVAAGCSAQEKAWLFADTAREFYRL